MTRSFDFGDVFSWIQIRGGAHSVLTCMVSILYIVYLHFIGLEISHVLPTLVLSHVRRHLRIYFCSGVKVRGNNDPAGSAPAHKAE